MQVRSGDPPALARAGHLLALLHRIALLHRDRRGVTVGRGQAVPVVDLDELPVHRVLRDVADRPARRREDRRVERRREVDARVMLGEAGGRARPGTKGRGHSGRRRQGAHDLVGGRQGEDRGDQTVGLAARPRGELKAEGLPALCPADPARGLEDPRIDDQGRHRRLFAAQGRAEPRHGGEERRFDLARIGLRPRQRHLRARERRRRPGRQARHPFGAPGAGHHRERPGQRWAQTGRLGPQGLGAVRRRERGQELRTAARRIGVARIEVAGDRPTARRQMQRHPCPIGQIATERRGLGRDVHRQRDRQEVDAQPKAT